MAKIVMGDVSGQDGSPTGEAFTQRLASLRRMIEARQASQGAPCRVKPLEETVSVCERHGSWQPYRRDEQGVLRCASPVCPACRRESALRAMSEASETPEAFQNATLENFECTLLRQKSAIQTVREHVRRMTSGSAKERGDGLILWGGSGTGKTHIAIGMLRECQAAGMSGHFIRAVVLMPLMRRCSSLQARHEDLNAMDRLSEVGVLVIDDVGKTGSTDFERSGLFALIDTRWAYSRPTIITTNASPTDLKDLLTPAGFDRLTAGGANILRMDWKSHRSIRVVSP